ncbi:MAG TPA: hypothetical protein VGK00_00285 [Anaerolineales bacterium]|jgi:hypothetical protein
MMLHTITKQSNKRGSWELMRKPLNQVDAQADTHRLTAKLNEGWQILETASYLAHGRNTEGNGYLLTLYHPRLGLSREWSVKRSPEMDALLAFEAAPGYAG